MLPRNGCIIGTWDDLMQSGIDLSIELPEMLEATSDKDQYVLLEQNNRIWISGNNERATLFPVYEYISRICLR